MSNSTAHSTKAENNAVRYLVVLAIVVGAFFGAYRFALAKNAGAEAASSASSLVAAGSNGGSGSSSVPNGTATTGGSGSNSSASGSGGGGCACCGGGSAPTANGVTGSVAKGSAKVAGGVQKISVDLSQGTYNPNTIVLKAGVPAEITFGQGDSCAAQIVSQDLGFNIDTSNGAQTVKLPGLKAGEYKFSCSMQMVFGKIVVK